MGGVHSEHTICGIKACAHAAPQAGMGQEMFLVYESPLSGLVGIVRAWKNYMPGKT